MAKHVERERKYGRGRREVGWAHNIQRVLIQKKRGKKMSRRRANGDGAKVKKVSFN